MKTYLKTLSRTFKKQVTRFLSLVFMVLISIGFISGVGSMQDKINYSMTDYYKAQAVSDFIIKSKSENGFSAQDIQAVKELFPDAKVDSGASVDIAVGEKRSLRLYFLDFENWSVNIPDIIEGEKPADKTQVYAERPDKIIKGYSVGEEISLDFKDILIKLGAQNGTELSAQVSAMLNMLQPITVTVSGIIQNPILFEVDGEPSYNNPADASVSFVTSGTKDLDCLENILYVSKDILLSYSDAAPDIPEEADAPFISTGDIYVAIENREAFNAFSDGYKKLAAEGKEKILSALGDVSVLTLEENFSFMSLYSYGKKIADIGYIIMAAFLLVTALVVLTTMTRLIEEERPQIACLKTLGYSSLSIVSKYLLFALIATGVGGVGGYFVGLALMRFIYFVFDYSFDMPPISSHVAVTFYITTLAVIVAATLFATAVAGFKTAGDNPAELLRPKPPKAGKKVILEKIPILWNRLPFRYKSTVRNVLRYKSRFFMTVVAVACSTALVIAGLSLLDLCLFHGFGSGAIMGITAVIVVFAGLLTMLVIYTLTNINISERNREIATLMVLGYQNGEVSGYIFREIFINSGVGILLGYPLACLLIYFVFDALAMGTLGGVSWFWWLIAPVIVIAFTGLVALILRRKIVTVDMNESLKAIE